jgi:1-acyl-sn-glycerol-3-phosphate acyltransferase
LNNEPIQERGQAVEIVTATANMTATSSKASMAKKRSANVQGLSLKSGVDNPNPIQHGNMSQAERAFSAVSTFLSGIMAISASQFIGAPLKLINPQAYDSYMARTKESFAILMTTITQWWAPTIIRVSGDESMKDQLFQMKDGSLKCNFPHRLVLMANHQLYTDWLYLWWIAYTNSMHGRIYIILKESLKQLPIIGWGMQFYNFIFLSRKWEQDKSRFKLQLDRLQNPDDPMWLLIFPEGTNLSAETRQKSAAWAEKTGIPDMKNQLLPRSTGLQFCLRELRHSTNWLYDCTIAYEGVSVGAYSQDVYTLRSSFLEGRPPKSVNMFWRRFKISTLPIDNDEAFARWLLNQWREKDYLLEYFNKFGHFPSYEAKQAIAAVQGHKKPDHAKSITTSLQGGGWDEFLGIFGPITSAAGAFSSIDLTEPLNFEQTLQKLVESHHLDLAALEKSTGLTKEQLMQKAISKTGDQSQVLMSLMKYLLAPEIESQRLHATVPAKVGTAQKSSPSIKISAKATITSSQPSKNIALNGRPPQAKASSSNPSQPQPKVNPAQFVRSNLPLTNTKSLITQPISTVVTQKVATKIQAAAAKHVTPTTNAKIARPGTLSSKVQGSIRSKPAVPKSQQARGDIRPPPVSLISTTKPMKASPKDPTPAGKLKSVQGKTISKIEGLKVKRT